MSIQQEPKLEDLNEEKIITKDQLGEVPKATGIYLFHGRTKDSAEESILYIGKAKSLYSRVRQYFIGDTDKRPFVQFIRSKADRIQYIVVKTEQDALLLENELIKKHKPPYNISLKDDKRYLSLRLDLKHEWPKIDVVRKILKDKAVYLGPFSSATRLRETLDFMQKIFPLRTCSDHKLYNRSRPCIEYEIKRCVAPCVNYVTKEQYTELVQGAMMFLKGKNEELVLKLGEAMEVAANDDRFEEAALIRDKVSAIRTTLDSQSVIGVKQFQLGINQDVIGFASQTEFAVVAILFVRNGIIFDKRIIEFKNIKLDRESFMIEFLERYYSSEVFVPDEILLPFSLNDEAIEIDSKVIYPKSEEKRNFIDIANKNAQIHLESRFKKLKNLEQTLAGLQKLISLKKLPQTIDCIDISHHQGLETVASVVRFQDGVPFKNGYRKIKMKVDQIDDFQSMKEAVERRYKTLDDLPDLIVIDGGKGQLTSAYEILKQNTWLENVDLVSLAKARDQEGIDPLNPQNRERIFKPHQKNPILLKADSNEELLLRYLRDEAHRFAITYHRFRKDKLISTSVLDEVEGMNEKYKLKLLTRFGGIEEIREANDEDLVAVIPKKLIPSLRLTLQSKFREPEEA
ncbi:MAG: excinuclease ABC subunit UvrC [Deltaproteobacteria bacterium]|nr:excinuclease ABC subunit UvrC [Deltaproteobacteria bacterium]